MEQDRYWGLFGIAAGLSVHAFLVGKLLGSSFFMMLFFWGFVAIAALRGALDAAQSMVIVMILLLMGAAAASLLHGAPSSEDMAFYTFALYPALVSWCAVFFYIRYLRQNASPARPVLR